MLEQTKKELLQKLQSPEASLAMLLDQAARNDEAVQFLLARLRAAQELPGKWRTEFPNSDVAERCATDLEAIVISPEDRKTSS